MMNNLLKIFDKHPKILLIKLAGGLKCQSWGLRPHEAVSHSANSTADRPITITEANIKLVDGHLL